MHLKPPVSVDDRIALYLHFPFCRQRCHYCSFISYAGREADIPAYVNALEAELAQRSEGKRLCSIFFGGGTPSLLPADQLARVLSTIRSLFTFDETTEITLEANPGTIDQRYLMSARELGVNRLSLGIQSLDDNILLFLGRTHRADQAIQAVNLARNARFDNINFDLLYGIPRQTMDCWKKTLKKAINIAPEHLSLYPLTLEDGVPLKMAIQNGESPAINHDLAAEHYELAEDFLESEGYNHYEISNWAIEGAECRHNMVYWQCKSYLGVGVAAHSFIHGHRQANITDLDKYLLRFQLGKAPLTETDDEISEETGLWERIVLGLRLTRGIEYSDFIDGLGIDIYTRFKVGIDELIELGLLESDGKRLKLTRRGRLLGNEVFWRFLPGQPDKIGAID